MARPPEGGGRATLRQALGDLEGHAESAEVRELGKPRIDAIGGADGGAARAHPRDRKSTAQRATLAQLDVPVPVRR
jgi:hypothetical protein